MIDAEERLPGWEEGSEHGVMNRRSLLSSRRCAFISRVEGKNLVDIHGHVASALGPWRTAHGAGRVGVA
jgi:hypothetical protein